MRSTRILVLKDPAVVKAAALNAALSDPMATTHEIIAFVKSAAHHAKLEAQFGSHPRITLVPLAFDDPRARWIREEIKSASSSTSSRAKSTPAPRFIITTGANAAYAGWLTPFVRSVGHFDYPLEIYDLGGLGYGVPLRGGKYKTTTAIGRRGKRWESKALHKPTLVEDCRERYGCFTIYLDADTLVLRPIDEVVEDGGGGSGFDVGVTIRTQREMLQLSEASFEYTGYINAGVIFFAPTPAATTFVRRWKTLTRKYENDQKALNLLVNPRSEPLTPGKTFTIDGANGGVRIRIRTFPGAVYNKSCTLRREIQSSTKIVHFKSNVDRQADLRIELGGDHAYLWIPPIEKKLEIAERLAGIRSSTSSSSLAQSYAELARAAAERQSHMYYWERVKLAALEDRVQERWTPKKRRVLFDHFTSIMKKRAELIEILERDDRRRSGDRRGHASDLFDQLYWECESIDVRRGARVFDLDPGSGGLVWCLREIWDCDATGRALSTNEDEQLCRKALRLTRAIGGRKKKLHGRYDAIVAVTDAFKNWQVAECIQFITEMRRHLRKRGVLHLRFVELPPVPVVDLLRRMFDFQPTANDTLLRIGLGG